MRTGLAFACLGTACCVPFLALVMSLIGSLLTIGASIILPVAIHTKIFQVCFQLVSPCDEFLYYKSLSYISCCFTP